jgi:hypothetical protein
MKKKMSADSAKRTKVKREECVIPPPLADKHFLSTYTLINRADEYAIRDYVEWQADDEKVQHAEKIKTERVFDRTLAGPPGEPPRDDGRSAPRGTLRPDVGPRAQANGAKAAECAGVRQEECGDFHRVGKAGDWMNE